MSEQNKIDEIKEALAAATPGPWEVVDLGDVHIAKNYRQKGDMHTANWIADMYCEDEAEKDQSFADAHLIAKAPEYITYLLQLVDELKEALEEPKKNLWFQLHNERIKKHEVTRERNELLRKIERKDEALRFYADAKQYEQEKCSFDAAGTDVYWEAPEIMQDLGQRAREAL